MQVLFRVSEQGVCVLSVGHVCSTEHCAAR